MYILGILYSRDSTVCLLKDGMIISAVSEEKFSRIKNDNAFPVNALRWTLQNAGIGIEEIDHIALSTQSYKGHSDYQLIRKFSSFKIEDYVYEQSHYWRPRFFEKKDPVYRDVFKHKISFDQYDPDFWREYAEKGFEGDYRVHLLKKFFGANAPPITTMEHHRCHSAYAYYASPFRGKDCLILTIDAFGDGYDATISRTQNGKIERLFATDKFIIARLYKFMTLLLGMKPNEHEFKVMGLAPYAKEPILAKPYQIFSETLQVDGLDFKFKVKPTDNYYYFKDKFEGCRFDGIAAGLQRYTEDILTQWVHNIVEKYKIKRLVLSGGLAMNIKAMGKIGEMPEVDELYVCGCGSDESTAIGAAYSLYEDLLTCNGGKKIAEKEMKPLKTLYLGPDIAELTRAKLDAILKPCKKSYEVISNPTLAEVATRLSQGKVIARCIGRTEFGARALGNRSILADPRNKEIIGIINEKIKNRDFWMPFAPIILDTFEEKYMINPKKFYTPHMTLAFETKPLAHAHIAAGLHPADKTARPQVLVREDNPPLYDLLVEFQKITGVGGLVNTSFNLHGLPIVCTPEDGILVLENSELDGIFLPGFLVMRK